MKNPNTSKAYNYLRSKILDGDFTPGVFLSAQSIAKDIGVSRTPVREALRQLESEELVHIIPKLGAVVTSLDSKDFQELLGYREALEVYTAGRAAELCQPEEVEHLKEILEAMRQQINTFIEVEEEALLKEPINKLAQLDIQFHRLIFIASRNNMLKERFERTNLLQRFISPSFWKDWIKISKLTKESAADVFEEHVHIFESIRDKNVEKARNTMRQHFQNLATKFSHFARLAPDETDTLHELTKR